MTRFYLETASAIVGVLVTVFRVISVEGNSSGAPLASCLNMGNLHVAFPAQDPVANPCPFDITLDQQRISVGGSVWVTLHAKSNNLRRPDYFTGFLVMAFDKENEISGSFGSFSELNQQKAQHLSCYNRTYSAVTHVNNNFKPNVTFLWTAPDGFIGRVFFRATFSKNLATLWAGIPSADLTINNEPSAPTTTVEATTPTPITGRTGEITTDTMTDTVTEVTPETSIDSTTDVTMEATVDSTSSTMQKSTTTGSSERLVNCLLPILFAAMAPVLHSMQISFHLF